MKTKITLATFLLTSLFMYAQTVQDRAQIIKSNNQERLQQLIVDFESKFVRDQEKVIAYSQANNIPIFKENEDGSFDQLVRISKEGIPIYYSLDNVDAAISTRANRLHNGGSLGLNIEGQNMTAHVWDGGPTRLSHQEFTGAVGGRASAGDGVLALNNNSFHATHVSGTIAARGTNPSAKGMAPQANVITHDWINDESEMAAAGASGALISNHSYGVRVSSYANAPGLIGKYTASARNIDEITYNAPYYLPVYSAGNDGSNSNSDPLANGYDKLTGDKVSKNTMVVANALDANINANGSLGSVVISTGSSQGPSDDLRIKPDITGNGTGVLSSFDSADNAYGSISGTSMAAPNVAGSMLLLQQYYNQKNGVFMRSATLRGLTLHTADDFAVPGPDAITGWGLMNTMAAANAITGNKLNSRIEEVVLQNGQTYSVTVESDGLSPLLASITWTDPAGQVNNGGSNDGTPALVNDLDIRVTQNGVISEPWKLTGPTANGRGDNIVDNFERVDISGASGTYTITVTHKGTLVGGSQPFSLIVTGEFNNYAVTSSTKTVEACNDQVAVFPLEFLTSSNFSDTATFSTTGLPNGVNAVFSSATFNSTGTGTLSISNLNGANDGTYPFTVVASTPTETKTLDLNLRIISANITTPNFVFPLDQATRVSTSAILDWDDELNAQRYEIQISTNPSFGRTLVTEIVSNSSYALSPAIFFPSITYYWRVKAINDCGQGAFTTQSFTTFSCNEINASLPSPIAIPDDNATGIQSTLNINEPGNPLIGKLSVYVRSIHEYSGDLVIFITSPSGTTTLLKTTSGCASPDVDATFDNDALPAICNTTPGQAGYSGPVAPEGGDLSVFDGENINGNWTLTVRDQGPADLGSLNNWKITYCEQPVALSNDDISEATFTVYPNPSNGNFTIKGSNVSDSDQAIITIVDLNGRVVFNKDVQNVSQLNETIDVQNLNNGLYLLQVQQGASSTVEKIIINK